MNKRFIFFLFFMVLGLVTMDNTLPLMAAPYIVGELGGSSDIAFYVVTFYSIGNAIGVPIGRGAIGRANPSHFFLGMLTLSAFCSLLMAFCTSYPELLVLRLFKGIIGGAFFPIITQLSSEMSPPEIKTKNSSIIVTIFTVVPAFAAALGGWIAYDYHWIDLFYITGPLFIFCALGLFFTMRKADVKLEKVPFDGIGYLFYTVTILSLGLAVTMGQELDWQRSPIIVGLEVLGVFALGFFVLWELNHPYPLIEFRLLKNFAFFFALLSLMILFSSYFGMVILLGFWLTLWVNYTPLWVGLIIGTMAVAGFIPRLLFLQKYEKLDCRIPIIISALLLAYSSVHTMYFNVEIDLGRIASSRIVAGFGLAFFLTPLFRICFHTFPAAKTMSVIGFFQVVRVLSSGLGAAFYITLWQRRYAFFHDRLGSQLTIYSDQTADYFARAKNLGLEGQPAVAELSTLLDRQAIALALDDCFYLMSWMLTILCVLIVITRLCSCKGFRPEQI